MNSRFVCIGTIVSDIEIREFKTQKGESQSKRFILEEDRCFGRKVPCQYEVEFVGNLISEVPDKELKLKGARVVIVGHLWGSSFKSKDNPNKTVWNLVLRGDRFVLLSTPDMKLPDEDNPNLKEITDMAVESESIDGLPW